MANLHQPTDRMASTVSAASDELDGLVAVDLDFGVVATAALDHPVADLAPSGDGNALVATHYGQDCVSIVDANTLLTRRVVPLPGDPFAVAVSDEHAYVSTVSLRNTDAVAVIDLDTGAVTAGYPLAFSISALATTPDGKRVFAGRSSGDRADIAVIDTTAERVGTIAVASGPGINIDALEVADNGRRLYAAVSDARSSQLMIVNVETARIDRAIGIGAPIRDVAVGPEGRSGSTAYVLTSDRFRGGSVAVVDLAAGTVRKRIDIGGAPTQLVLSSDGTRAFIVDYDSVAVLCTSTNEVVHVIDVGTEPACVALSPDAALLYVTDFAGGVTTFSVASTMPLLYSPFAATDPIPLPARAGREPAVV